MSNVRAVPGGVPTPRRSGDATERNAPDSCSDDGILHWNERTLVRRVALPDGSGTVIHKRALGCTAVERTIHEREILERLHGVTGVAQLQSEGGDDTLVLADHGGRTLTSILAAAGGPDDPLWVCRLALGLARIMADVHEAGVLHRDLNPGNVLVCSGPEGQPEPIVIDFDLATTLAPLRTTFLDPREEADRLPYLPPEQTGRTAVPVDQRSDLYSLGATLYEAATGRPPFVDDDPLHLVGRILARHPEPPIQLAPRLPESFSRILLRLLAKEPDDRYSSATGLAHDLAAVLADPDAALSLGERDFPQQLTPPTRLVGRDREIAVLTEALDKVVSGSVHGVLVSGGPGTGKSALVEQLRPLVVSLGGWFVSGKGDQYRSDATTSLFVDAMDRLGHLLLAEPEEQLTYLRRRALAALGDNAGVITALIPSFQGLLGVAPAEWAQSEAPTMSARVIQASRDLLREIVSPQRPLVLLLDDLQWANSRAFQVIDGLLTDPSLGGLLVVGAYRDSEVTDQHPLAGMTKHWQEIEVHTDEIHLDNLLPDGVADLVAEMLRLPVEQAAELGDVLSERTDGNPYDTVELINALRRDGALVVGESGWTWNARTIRRYVGTGDVVDLLTDRIAQLPEECRLILRIMAHLGSDLPVPTLAAACALEPAELITQLMPALDDGLVVADDGVRNQRRITTEAHLRFRHDRVQQAAHDGLVEGHLAADTLVLARRLADTEDLDAAAQLYLEVLDLLDDPDEQRRVVELFRTVATRAQQVSKYSFVYRYIVAAAQVHRRSGAGPDDPLAIALDVERQGALYALGRLDEADKVYARVAARLDDPADVATPGCRQIAGLTIRGRHTEAIVLGLELLERLGVSGPATGGGLPHPHEMAAQTKEGFDRLERWLEETTVEQDAARPEPTDPAVRAAAAILMRLCPTAFFTGQPLQAWLVAQAGRLWIEHGPQADLVPCLGHANSRTTQLRPTAELDRKILRRAVSVGTARGYRAATAHAKFLDAGLFAHQSSTLEDVVAEAREARKELCRAGELQYAAYTYFPALAALLDSAPTLGAVRAEAGTGAALAQRAGNGQMAGTIAVYRQLCRALRGQTTVPGTLAEDIADEVARAEPFVLHSVQAIAAAILEDPDALRREIVAAKGVAGTARGTYSMRVLDFLQGYDAALRAGSALPAIGTYTATGTATHTGSYTGATAQPETSADTGAGADPDVEAALAVLDAARRRLRDPFTTEPANCEHLALFLDAERARAVGDVPGALRGYDAALMAADRSARPWHQAFFAERAGTLALTLGLERLGRTFVTEARRRYHAWGAAAKVAQLDEQYPWARRQDLVAGAPLGVVTSPTPFRCDGERCAGVDLPAVLRASQAISAETDPDRLRTVLVEQLSSLTGATDVLVVLPDDEGAWSLQPGGRNTGLVGVEAAGERGLLPLAAFRYVERTREPLLVMNAVMDERFVRDRFVTRHARSSLLAVPVLGGTSLHAVIVLANHLTNGAFTTEQLDAVQLAVAQLAVTLGNARRFRNLEVQVATRTEALHAAKEQLEVLSVTDPLTDVANRRRFDHALDKEWARGLAEGRPLALLMIDIDDFKEYNDVNGHLAGDECLQALARALGRAVRTSDLVCRYGGEEFAIILPRAEIWNAFGVAQRIQEAIHALAIPHPGTLSRVTVSIGVAARTPDDDHFPQQLVTAAETALEEAKHAGRDQVVAMPPQ